MMKTTMRQLIEMLDEKHQEMISKDRLTSAEACKMLKEIVTEFLPTERQQLQSAWNDGEKEGFVAGVQYCEDGSCNRISLFPNYFKTTYNE